MESQGGYAFGPHQLLCVNNVPPTYQLVLPETVTSQGVFVEQRGDAGKLHKLSLKGHR